MSQPDPRRSRDASPGYPPRLLKFFGYGTGPLPQSRRSAVLIAARHPLDWAADDPCIFLNIFGANLPSPTMNLL